MLWWERWPGLLESEKIAFEQAGFQTEIDEKALSRGCATLKISASILNSDHIVNVLYPDLYPYFRPGFFCEGLEVKSHYNPFGGDMCLLRRGTENWLPGMNAAQLFVEQLPKWEKASTRSRDESKLDEEDDQAEPFSVYYPSHPFMQLLINSNWKLPQDQRVGHLTLRTKYTIEESLKIQRLLGLVFKIRGDDGGPNLYSVETPLYDWANKYLAKTCEVPWVRFDAPPLKLDPQALLDEFVKMHPQIGRLLQRDLYRKPNIFGFCFPEERERGLYGDGWLFLMTYPTKTTRKKKKGKIETESKAGSYFITSEPFSSEDFFQRINYLTPLSSKTVAVVGLGCLGSNAANMLAQSGIGELRLLDGDHVSPSTSCRTAYELLSSSLPKMEALAEKILKNYPFTKIAVNHYPPKGKKDEKYPAVYLGRNGNGFNEDEIVLNLLKDVDLVLDATAEPGIHHYLSDRCREFEIPYVFISSRVGGVGGEVVRILPGKTGCYACYAKKVNRGEIEEPPFDKSRSVQAAGCGNVSFEATAFDILELVTTGVRLICSMLCEGHEGKYRSASWDVAILSLVSKECINLPTWKTYKLSVDDGCECQIRLSARG